MKELPLAHIGIAVADLEEAKQRLGAALGVTFEPAVEVEAQAVRVSFAPGAKLELVQATSEQSPTIPMLPHPIRSHLERHGEGLHHISYLVPDVAAAIRRLHDAGVRTLTDEPQRGAHDTRVVFLHPEDCQGVLIELCEGADDGDLP